MKNLRPSTRLTLMQRRLNYESAQCNNFSSPPRRGYHFTAVISQIVSYSRSIDKGNVSTNHPSPTAGSPVEIGGRKVVEISAGQPD